MITTSGEPLPNALVELISTNTAAVPHVAVTNANGVVTFSDMKSGSLQLIASADRFVTSTMRIGNRSGEVVFTLSRGDRVLASVQGPPAGPQVVRVPRRFGEVTVPVQSPQDRHEVGRRIDAEGPD